MFPVPRKIFRRIQFAGFVLFAFFAFQIVLPRANAQVPLRRLTATGDVLDFVWSPRGDALYVTRASETLKLSALRSQVTGDLYRVAAQAASSQLLARNANSARPSPAGDEIAFTRLAADGSARLIGIQVNTQETRDFDAITWGVVPQWSGAGDALFYPQNGNITRATRTERTTTFDGANVPSDAHISSAGDRAAFVGTDGLEVVQSNERRVWLRNENDTRVLPALQWSNAGDKLAFIVTRSAFKPEVWIADTTRGTTKKIAQGALEYFANLAWSPNDAFVIFTRTPTGSSNADDSEIWRASADGSSVRAMTQNHAEESLPQYAPDGKSIAFLRDGDVWVMDLDAKGLPISQNDGANANTPDYKTPRVRDAQRTPPATIRVKHDAANACRSVPLGQIDTLDFETYVKRVVPAEVYPSWDDDALKTQAVAARSYAWFWILQHGALDYDVTDSTAYQYMCDTRYGSTDDATDATRGQYLDYAGYMVFAAYGAENGDPTLTNTSQTQFASNPYLIGVDDPVGFGETRAGNGIGFSQWGAQRWATQYNWNYQQILLHYYTGVTVEASAGALPDGTAPLGAIVAPWSNWGITANRVLLRVNASDDASGIASIDLNAQYFDGTTTQNAIIATLFESEREFIWDVSALPNQTNMIVTPTIRDAIGNGFTASSITFNLDRKKPQGTLNAPATTQTQTVALTLNASDNGSSGLAAMTFSNDWEWQGENQYVQANSGTVVNDPEALNGFALRGVAGTDPAGAWYGPYTNILPEHQNYRAYFRLKTDNVTTPNEVALLDVVSDGGTNILGLKSLRGTDFKNANEYQEFYVDFVYAGFSANAPEFRVGYRASASLWLDRILVVSYPTAYANSSQWTLSAGEGTKRLVAKFADGAGNVSSDAIANIFFGTLATATPTATPTPILTPRAWLPFILDER
jgi:hypothetical protein